MELGSEKWASSWIMLVLNVDLPLDFFFILQCVVNNGCFSFVYGIFPPQLLLHFPRYLVASQSSHIPNLYSRKELIDTDRGYQTVSLQSGWATRLHRIRSASVLSYPSSSIWENRTRWKNPRFWHYQSGQPRHLKQKKLFAIAFGVAWRRNCILWGNKTWISGSPLRFHLADKWLLFCPHLKMNKTSVLMWRHRNNKCCHLVIEGVDLSMCCKEEQALLVLKSVLSCSEVKQSLVVPGGWKCQEIYGQANLWIVFIQFMGVAEGLVWLQLLGP